MTRAAWTLVLAAAAAACGPATGMTSVRAPKRPRCPAETALRARLVRQYQHTLPQARGAVVVALFDAECDRELVMGFGAVAPDQARPPDRDTVFEIGSVTKAVVGVLLGDEVVAGRVALSDDAQRYLRELRLPVHPGGAIRVEHLATFSSGLPFMPTNWVTVDEGIYTPAMWRDFLANYRLEQAPGQSFRYGNVGFGVLGDLLAAREGTSLGALLEQRIFAPLGMTRSFLLDGRALDRNTAQGVDDQGTAVPLLRDKPLQAGCCAIQSTGHDLLRFLRAALVKDAPGRLGAAFALALTPRRHGEADYADVDVGLGWMLRTEDGIAEKSGLMKGYRSGVVIDRPHRLTTLVLAADAAFPSEALAADARRALLLERAPPPLPVVADLPRQATHQRVAFADGLELVGWVAPASAAPGQTITLRYFFRVAAPPRADYRIFVHAEGGGRRTRADHDPVRPSSEWPVGAIIEDRFTLTVPADQPAGPLTLWSGFFRGPRLKVVTAPASDGHDRARGPVVVVKQR